MASQRHSWWFFKRVHGYSMDEQKEAAKAVLPDDAFWIGQMQGTRFDHCRTVTTLINNKGDTDRHKHPICSGDTLWVHNLFCLGATVPKIQKTIQTIHNAGIQLRIYTIGYNDIYENGHYALTSALFTELNIKSKKYTTDKLKGTFSKYSTYGKRKPGRPAYHISYWSLTDKGRKLIREYCLDQSITPEDFYSSFNSQDCLGLDSAGNPILSISWSRLRPLVQEVDRMLHNKGYETYRSRAPRSKSKE